MECFERGIITTEDLGGRTLSWGSIDDFEYVLRLIAKREGIGDLFAKGTMGAAKNPGNGHHRFSGYDPRAYPAQLLSFCTADIGAHHNRAWSITADVEIGRDTIKGKADIVIYLQHIRPLFDTWSCCRLFWGELDVTPAEHVATINMLTGWDLTLDECLLASERVWNLNRAHFIERNGGPGRNHDHARRLLPRPRLGHKRQSHPRDPRSVRSPPCRRQLGKAGSTRQPATQRHPVRARPRTQAPSNVVPRIGGGLPVGMLSDRMTRFRLSRHRLLDR
ncbi:MAG: hypothetical protein GY854_16155 [Deltaproteobacteria bacterium]|nr:hypothetical protein [Deltaproteobacteria bacterium]